MAAVVADSRRQDRSHVVVGVVVRVDRRSHPGIGAEVAAARAEIPTGAERCVEDVADVGDPVAVAVRNDGRPGGGQKLHGFGRPGEPRNGR